MHRCAEIHNAMSETTGNVNKTSEEHRELIVATIRRDVKYLQITHGWFTENYPFPEKTELMFFSTRLTALQESDIYCDKTNKIGAKIYPPIIKHTHQQKCP